MDQQFCQSAVAVVTDLRNSNSNSSSSVHSNFSSTSSSYSKSSSLQEAAANKDNEILLDKQRSTLKYQIMKANELASSGNVSVFYKQRSPDGLQPEFVPILPNKSAITSSNSSEEDQSSHQKVPQQIGVDSKAAVTTPITYANRPAVSHVSNNHPVPSSTSAAVIKTHTDITEEASLQQVLEQKKALTVTQVNKAPVSKPPVQTNQQQKLVRSPGQAKSPQKSAQPQQVKVPIVQHQQGKPQVVQHQQGKSPVVPHQQGKPQVVQHQQGKSPVVQHQQGKSPVVQHQQQGKSPVVQHQQQGKSPVVQHQQQGKSPVVQQHQQQGKSPVVQQQQVKQIVQSGGGRLQPVQVKPKVTPIQAVKTVVQSLPTPVQAKKLLTVHFKPNQIQGKQQQQQPIAQQIVQGNALQNKPPQQSTSPVKQVNVQSKPVQNQFRVQTVNKPLQPSQVSAGKQQQQQTYAPPQKSFQPPPPQQTPPPPPPPPPPPQLPKSVQLTPANSSAANSSVQQPTARINVQTAASTFNVTSKRPNTTAPTADNSASPAKRTTLLQDIERNHLAPPSSLTERCRKSYQSTKKKTKVVPSLTDADINKFKLPSHVAAQVLQQAKQLNQQSKPVFQLKHSPVGGVTPFPPVTATVLPAGLSQAITLLTNQNKVATTVSTPSATETPPPAQTTTTSGAEKQLNIPFQQIPENNQTFKIIVVTNEKNWSFLMDGSGTQVAEALAQAGLREEVGRAIMESTLRQGAKTPQILQVVDGKSGQAVQQTQSQVMEKEEESAEVSPHDGSPTPSKSETEIYREGRLALCHHCGFSSPTYDFCTRCKTKLPPDVKSICLNPVLPELQSNVLVKRTSEVAVAVADSPKKRQKVSKKKKVEEPVCLTISSDDEDANDSKSNNFKLPGLDAVDEPGAAINQDPAITQSAMMKEPVIADEEEEEEEGVKDGEFQDQMESDMCGEMGAMKGEFDNLNSSDTNSEWPVAMDCRTVRIGSYKVVPNDRVYMTLRGIIINIPAIDCESVRVYIPWQSIVKILAHFGKGMPVLFIYTTASMGAKIRKMLGMTDKTNFPYFDPASANESQKRITLLPEDMSTECSTTLKKLFVNLQKTEYDELSQHEANAILVQASPKEVQNQVQKANVVPRLPTDIQTIMVYPPPPAKGGIPINTEDYACLGEDQFLNDVIIDFYLKYLHEHYLCKSDQTRTHILSTFFYKRLTTKPTTSRRSLHNPVENDPKATAAEKRHSRVKSWTKHVDIFKKDFIIIPINEHSHWFLAVICFPGLTSPVDFETNQPIDVAADTKAATSKTKPDSTDSKSDMMAGKTSLVIGSTTITALGGSVTVQAQAGAVAGPGPDTVTLLQSEEEDRDEADGEDEDFDQASSEEEQDTDTSAIKNEIDDKKEPEPSVEEQEQESPEAAKEEKRKRSRKKEPRMPIKQPCILIFDSLATASRAKVVATLRDYLKVEYKVKHGVERQFTKEFMKGASPKVPQQTNYTDCGLYVLQYVEAFFQAPITDYHIPMKMLQEWFGVDVVNRKRYDIQQLLHKLMGEQGIDFSTLNLPDLNLAPFPHGLVDYPSSEDEMMAEEGEEEEEEEYQEYGEAYRAMCEDARFNGYRDEEEEDEDDDEEHGGGGDHRRRLTVIGDEEMDCDAEFDEEEEEEEMEQEVEEGLDEEEEDCEEEEEDEEGGLGREMCDEELMDEMVPNVVGLKSYRIPRLNQQSHREDIKMNQSVSIIMPGSISDNNCDSRATSNNDE